MAVSRDAETRAVTCGHLRLTARRWASILEGMKRLDGPGVRLTSVCKVLKRRLQTACKPGPTAVNSGTLVKLELFGRQEEKHYRIST